MWAGLRAALAARPPRGAQGASRQATGSLGPWGSRGMVPAKCQASVSPACAACAPRRNGAPMGTAGLRPPRRRTGSAGFSRHRPRSRLGPLCGKCLALTDRGALHPVHRTLAASPWKQRERRLPAGPLCQFRETIPLVLGGLGRPARQIAEPPGVRKQSRPATESCAYRPWQASTQAAHRPQSPAFSKAPISHAPGEWRPLVCDESGANEAPAAACVGILPRRCATLETIFLHRRNSFEKASFLSKVFCNLQEIDETMIVLAGFRQCLARL